MLTQIDRYKKKKVGRKTPNEIMVGHAPDNRTSSDDPEHVWTVGFGFIYPSQIRASSAPPFSPAPVDACRAI
jgi:hypothetical protein